MSDEEKPTIDEAELKEKAKKNPKSKKWNNPNSRRNLRQYRDKDEEKEDILIPEVEMDDSDDDAARKQAEIITVGRKLDKELVKRLVPKRGVLTQAENKRFQDIVISFLADFKNEEPTASDIDDIFEIAKCEIYDTRLMDKCKDSPDAIISASKASESLNKRKQKAKENLANRRLDRKDMRLSQDVSIVDLAARYDNKQREIEKERVVALLEKEKKTAELLTDIIKKESF